MIEKIKAIQKEFRKEYPLFSTLGIKWFCEYLGFKRQSLYMKHTTSRSRLYKAEQKLHKWDHKKFLKYLLSFLKK
jgi:hypothetical protein